MLGTHGTMFCGTGQPGLSRGGVADEEHSGVGWKIIGEEWGSDDTRKCLVKTSVVTWDGRTMGCRLDCLVHGLAGRYRELGLRGPRPLPADEEATLSNSIAAVCMGETLHSLSCHGTCKHTHHTG